MSVTVEKLINKWIEERAKRLVWITPGEREDAWYMDQARSEIEQELVAMRTTQKTAARR